MEDFRHERRMAALQEILARITGKSTSLLDFGEVSKRLKFEGGSDRGLQDIPIDAIVGSVGRYTDFTRGFLPRQDEDIERWARVKTAVTSGSQGLPPIEVYQLGDAYFVRDGHHRVSVARQLGAGYIQAYVTEIHTRVPLAADTTPDELILKAEYADFLQNTRVDILLPDAEFRLTVPGTYERLEEHIRAHRYFMGVDEKRDISMDEAVKHWYETVYIPVAQAIRDRGILREFPGRTETDLYLWISEYRYLLEKELGWEIRSDVAADELARKQSRRPGRIFQRLKSNLLDRLNPDQLENSPAPGTWLESKDTKQECLFRDLLIPLSGGDPSWCAVDQAIQVEKCDNTHLNGLHVTRKSNPLNPEALESIRQQFEQRCEEANIQGRMAFAEGEISRVVIERALMNDLVVLNLAHPPGSRIVDRLSSGLRTIIRRCARPILAVPGKAGSFERLLVAYNSSLKGRQVLTLAAYFARRQQSRLNVVCVTERPTDGSGQWLREARKYLESHGIDARYHHLRGEPGKMILQTGRSQNCTMILMGGYGFSPVVEVVVGSAVDAVLRETVIPVLICQ